MVLPRQVLVYLNAQELGSSTLVHATPNYHGISALTLSSHGKGRKYIIARFLHYEISDWFETILPEILNPSLLSRTLK